MRLYRPFILFLALFLSACSTETVPKHELEKQITELRADSIRDLAVKEAELKSTLGEVIAGKNAQIQRGADLAYSANYAFKFYEKPTRLDIIINNRVQEFMAAMGVAPTLEAIKDEVVRLERELDETLTSMDELRAINASKIAENEALVKVTQSYENSVKKLEAEKLAIEREFNAEIQLKQSALNEANNVIIAKEKENAESRKYIEANKLRISIASGLLAVACVAGAFFSPIFKDKLALGAGLFGAISIGIIFIEPWHVACAFGLILIVALTWFLRKHFISNKTNENLINAIQSIKDKGGSIYETHIKPELKEWNTKYLKSGDKIEDKMVTGHIDEILKDYERK